MNKELEETVLQVAEYTNADKQRVTKTVQGFFLLGILALVINVAMDLMEVEGTFWTGFGQGATIGIAIGSMVLGILYTTGALMKVQAFKRRMLGKEKEAA